MEQPLVVLHVLTNSTLITNLNLVRHVIYLVLIAVDLLPITVNHVLVPFTLMEPLNHANNATPNAKNVMEHQQVAHHAMTSSILKPHPIHVRHVIVHV
jgi:hypothetical protein